MLTRIEYEARTAAGALISIFENPDQARKWWRERSCEFPGCAVKEITVTTSERVLWKARLSPVLPARERSGSNVARRAA